MANDKATSMDSRPANGAFEHLGILNGVAFTHINRHLCLAKLRNTLQSVLQIHLASLAVRPVR